MNVSSLHPCAVPLTQHESLLAEKDLRIAEQKERLDEQAVMLAELRTALELERQRNANSATASQGKLERLVGVVQKQSRYAVSQVFWAVIAFLIGITLPAAPAFYREYAGSVWAAGFVTLYGGTCLYLLYRMFRYVFSTLRKAYESGPVALCNMVFTYGMIITFAGVMEKLTTREASNSMTGVIVSGLAMGACSFFYGRSKTAGSGERFPDVSVARQFM